MLYSTDLQDYNGIVLTIIPTVMQGGVAGKDF